jgi:hypothetical protein
MDITKIQAVFNQGGGPAGWADYENHRHYFRIWGGLAWPDKGAPGFIVVIGEGVSKNTNPAFYGLFESWHQNHNALLLKCAELASITDRFYSNSPEVQRILLHGFNKEQQKTQVAGVRIYDAPLLKDSDPTELFSYADAELDRRTSVGQKSVFLEACPLARVALQRLPKGGKNAETLLGLPEVTALFYVLGAMFMFPYKDPEPPGEKQTWDPLRDGFDAYDGYDYLRNW